jgi:hypothetical protein
VDKGNIVGQRYERLEVLMPAWINEKQNQVWLCVCDCGQIRFITTAVWNAQSRKSCGCLRREVSRGQTTAMNLARAGQPRSAKGKIASQAACKKMNAVRHSHARHVLIKVDPERLVGECDVCGAVPLKIMKHRVGNQRDQYLCWVGSLRVHNEYANARVRYPNHALEMFNKQANACAVCDGQMIRGDGLANDGMVLDHCHTTGYIRGFTHQRCNKGLAMFLDRPEVFRKAADYLERNR